MSTLDKVYASKPMQALQKAGAWMQSNNELQAISQGVMCSLGLTLAGAVFMIVALTLQLTGVLDASSEIYAWITAPYNMTIGLMSMAVTFCVGYCYTRNLGMKGELVNGIVCIVLFIMVAAPIESVELADGTTASMLQSTYLGSAGLFPAMIMPIITIRIIKFCQDHHIALRMPESVPQFLQDSFASAIPLIINILLWRGLDTLCQTYVGAPLPGTIIGLLAAPLAGLNSIPGMIIMTALCQLFWAFGLNGGGISGIVVFPILIQAVAENASLVAAGQAPAFSPVFLWTATSVAGGAGNVISLCVLCMRSKSEQLKAIGKVGLVPALFNINEPMCFGVPIMYNPTLFIPFILNPVIIAIVLYAGFSTGIFWCNSVLIMTALPVFVAQYAATAHLANLAIPIIGFVISYLCYLPFVKMYDRQLCEQEAADTAEAHAA